MRSRVTLASIAVLAAGMIAGTAEAQTYKLMTGPQGGVWVPLGGSFKVMFEKAMPGSTIQTLPGAGIANVKGIEENKAEFGFGNSTSTVDAIEGRAPFEKKATNVCQIANLYPQYFQIVALADAKVDKVADMKGKSIAVQTRGNTAEAISADMLKANSLSYTDMGKVNFMASYNDAAALLQDGHAQVFTLGTTIPASSVMDLASSRGIKMVPVSDAEVAAMKKINAGYVKGTIPAGTYPKQDADVPAIAYSAHFVTTAGRQDLCRDQGDGDADGRHGRRQQGDGAHDSEGHGRGYRRALPSGCGEVLSRGWRAEINI